MGINWYWCRHWVRSWYWVWCYYGVWCWVWIGCWYWIVMWSVGITGTGAVIGLLHAVLSGVVTVVPSVFAAIQALLRVVVGVAAVLIPTIPVRDLVALNKFPGEAILLMLVGWGCRGWFMVNCFYPNHSCDEKSQSSLGAFGTHQSFATGC